MTCLVDARSVCLQQLAVQSAHIQLRLHHSHTAQPLIPKSCSYCPQVMHQAVPDLQLSCSVKLSGFASFRGTRDFGQQGRTADMHWSTVRV